MGFSSQKVGDFIKVLHAKPWSLTLYGLRHVWCNAVLTGDSSNATVPAALRIRTSNADAGCRNAINSSPP